VKQVDRSAAVRRESLLYRAGAVTAGLAVVLYGVAFVIVAVTTPPPASGGAEVIEYVAAHRTIYIVRQLLWLGPSLFLMVVFLALAVGVRHQGSRARCQTGAQLALPRPPT